jgi:hypothetical protein
METLLPTKSYNYADGRWWPARQHLGATTQAEETGGPSLTVEVHVFAILSRPLSAEHCRSRTSEAALATFSLLYPHYHLPYYSGGLTCTITS